MLQTMEPFFILSSWSLVTTFLFPEGVGVGGQQRQGRVGIGKLSERCFLIPGTWRSAVTGARDDDVDLADDLVQLDHPESIHAGRERDKVLSDR